MHDIQDSPLAAELPPSIAIGARMKAFFVGDNRTNVNWGRAASIALRQLLAGSFEITGGVTGDWFNLSTAETGYVGTLTPARYYRFFRSLLLRPRRKLFSGTSSWNFCLAHTTSLQKIPLSALTICWLTSTGIRHSPGSMIKLRTPIFLCSMATVTSFSQLRRAVKPCSCSQ